MRAFRTRSLLLALLLASLLAGGAAPAQAQVWLGPAAVEVRAEDQGKPAAGAEVRLEYLEIEPADGPAPVQLDSRGRAIIGSLAEGLWRIEVSHPGAMTYRAEVLLRRDGKPDVVNAVQHNVPGAVTMMQVRFAKAKGGAAPPPRQVAAAPAPTAPAPEPSAPEPAPVPQPAAPTPAPVPPAPEAAPPTPEPEPTVPAPETPAPEAPAPEPPSPAPEPAPVPSPPEPATPEMPAPSVPAEPAVPAPPPPAPAPEPERPQPAPAPVTPQAPPAPLPAPKPEPPKETPVPTPTPAPPPVAAPPQPAPPRPTPVPRPAPAPQSRPQQEGSCAGCKPGESSLTVEAIVPPGAGAAGCGEGLRQALMRPGAAALPAGCGVLRIELPPNARYVRHRFEVQDGNGSVDCLAGKDCPGGGRWPVDPLLFRDGTGKTTVSAAFENRSPDRERRAVLTVYFKAAGNPNAPRPMLPTRPHQPDIPPL